MRVAQTCLENISPCQFWSISDRYPDLVSRLHVQIKLIGLDSTAVSPGLQILMVNFAFFAKTALKMSPILSRIAPALEIILNLSGQT